MSGEYTCTISTFQEEDTKKTKMIVYGNPMIVYYTIVYNDSGIYIKYT